MEYYGTGIGQQLQEPLHTIVTKDRFALITVMGNSYAILDIFLRMLSPEELKLGRVFQKIISSIMILQVRKSARQDKLPELGIV